MRINKPRLVAGLGVVVACASAFAGGASYNFNSAPPADLNFVVSQADAGWRDSGGVNNSGYIALFDSVNSQLAAVLIPDFDKGMVVKAFTFEVDLRIGNATGNGGRPADGFSISYARANDPVVADLSQEPPVANWNNYSLAGAPENGTKTGLAISFDTWQGNTQPDGGPDIEGIMINLDGKVVPVNGARGIPMPTRNGACDDATSMQTGPWDGQDTGSPDGLCWARLKVELDDAGKVTVTWKGKVIADKIPTGFNPSAGRIVFAGRTGGANENTHIDNLSITTIPSDKALYTGGTATAEGYTLLLSDSGQSQVNTGTIAVKIDDQVVTPTSINKDGPLTTIKVVTAPNWLVSGSVHKTEVRFSDTLGSANLGGVKDVSVSPYANLTPDMAVTGVNTGAANRGMLLRTWYVANADGTAMGDLANTTDRAEQELWGELGANQIPMPDDFTQAIPGTANKYAKEPEYLNHDEAGADQGMFTANAADPQRQAPEKTIPGTGGTALNNMACEALFFVQFTQTGLHTFGCNSDDGFALYAGKNPLDRYQVGGIKAGEFSGGRGTDANAPQTLFQILVREPGIYPMRFIWEEGGGGSNFELYQQLADGSLALLNDTSRAPNVVKTFWDGPRTPRPHITKVTPPTGFTGSFEVTIMDGDTSIVDGSVKLQINGADVTPTVTKNGSTSTVKWSPPAGRQWITGYNTARLMYDESGGLKRDQTIPVSVFPGADAVPSNSFTIEAEHFDNNGVAQLANGTGYTGDEYRGLAAVHNKDYYQDGNEPSQDGAYRATMAAGLNPHVPMDSQTDAAPNLDTARPGFEVTTNYKIGWAGNGEWYQYTRTVPAGIYTAYAAQSIDPAGTAGGDVAIVTGGTVKTLATIRGTPPGGWGNNGLLPAQDPWGGKGVFKMPGGSTVIRYITRGGDFDWFTLSPTTSAAKISQAPDPRDTIRNDRAIWFIENFTTSVANGSVSLEVDGAPVPAADVTTVYGTDGALVTWKNAKAGLHNYTVKWSDGSPQSFSSTMNVGPLPATGAFVIEAEDFNYESGKANPKKGTAGRDVDVMPYLGNAYDGLGAVANVDYGSDDGNDSDVYRKGESPNKNINDNLGGRWGKDRGTYDVTANYKLGWVNTADWGNYTRVVPAAKYEIWAALSYDGRDAGQLKATLGLVDNPAATTQTVTPLGSFTGSGTGGWGANNLVPMKDAGGAVAAVSLRDAKTFRFTMDSGDFDWFVLVPVGPYEEGGQPQFTKIAKNADGTITIEWTGGGTLQAAAAVTGPWQDVPGATSPFTLSPTGAMQFGRIRN